jgi:2-dehydro-3-deoxygalactonokinase
MLIGEELRAQALDALQESLVLVGAPKLTQRYGIALDHLGVPFQAMGQEATWLGLAAIAQSLEKSA